MSYIIVDQSGILTLPWTFGTKEEAEDTLNTIREIYDDNEYYDISDIDPDTDGEQFIDGLYDVLYDEKYEDGFPLIVTKGEIR